MSAERTNSATTGASMREARMVRHHLFVGGIVAAMASGLLVGRAEANVVNERIVLDGCEVGGGGNDIQSIQSHYEPDRDRIVVTLRLCAKAKRNAAYRVHLDHAAPFVGRVRAQAGCVSTVDTVVAQTPRGHRGVGSSRLDGDLVRFVVPLDKLHVGKPKDVPLVALWATSSFGGTEDRAPNRETGDGCAHPQATTETLVQARVAVTAIAFVGSYAFNGAIGSTPTQAISLADFSCQQVALNAGFTNTSGIFAWLANGASLPSSHIFNPNFGPIQTADGTVVAQSISDFANCTPSGNNCLQAPIDQDIHGNMITDNFIWTGAFPNGTNGGGALDDCQAWTSNSASDVGDGGVPIETNAGFTTGVEDTCDQSHHVMCLQFQ
jgi:hypothetical protein